VGYSSGAAEAAWKAQIMAAVPAAPAAHAGEGLTADFRIAQPTATSPGFDLDNLLDPVFSVVINGRGWFGGRRANLRWATAQKTVAIRTGLHLAVLENPPRLWEQSGAEVGLDGVYQGQLPIATAVEDYTAWVQSRMLRRLPEGPVGVRLDFTGESVNLGDVATGKVKVLIDGLWPVLGGRPSAPDDRRVAALILSKGVADLRGSVAIKAVRLPRPTARARPWPS
jgi:hypothetical protein